MSPFFLEFIMRNVSTHQFPRLLQSCVQVQADINRIKAAQAPCALLRAPQSLGEYLGTPPIAYAGGRTIYAPPLVEKRGRNGQRIVMCFASYDGDS